MKNILIRSLALIFFFLMLLFPGESLSGASAGLLLWFQTVLPTLLPCMILADYLLRIGADRYLTTLLAKPFSFLFGLGREGTYGAVVGFLCGYPMGAKTAASLLSQRKISKEEAAYLLSFTNQPSMMFIGGYLCPLLCRSAASEMTNIRLFSSTGSFVMLTLTMSIYGSALLISCFYRIFCNTHHAPDPVSMVRKQKSAEFSPLSLLETSMLTSCEVMVKIGGYMMLFTILERFLGSLSFLNDPAKAMISGFLEMTTGNIHAAALPIPWSIALCSGFTAFGGLCGSAQTANVLKDSDLSAGRYLCWKLLQGILAFAIAFLWCFFYCMGNCYS